MRALLRLLSHTARRAAYGKAVCGWRRRSRRLMRAARFAGSSAPRSYLVLAECADLCSADIAVVVFAAFCGENGDCRHRESRGARRVEGRGSEERVPPRSVRFCTRRLSISPRYIPPRQTPPSARAAFWCDSAARRIRQSRMRLAAAKPPPHASCPLCGQLGAAGQVWFILSTN